MNGLQASVWDGAKVRAGAADALCERHEGISGHEPQDRQRDPTHAPGRSRRRGARKDPVASAPAQTDTVDLTDAARMMQRVESLLAAAPVASRERVDAVRQAIASGAY